MAKQNSDLLASYEHDFTEHVGLLRQITSDPDPVSMLEKNQFALENAQKLLKQMEVEAMNFMDDDDVRKRVSSQIFKRASPNQSVYCNSLSDRTRQKLYYLSNQMMVY